MVITSTPRFFDEEILPSPDAKLAGYAWLIYEYQLSVPVPEFMSVVVPAQNVKRNQERWNIWGSKYQPESNWFGHLCFALKYEGVDLGVMRSLFARIEQDDMCNWISAELTGAYSRRIWFFYEWLTQQVLPIKSVTAGNYVDALDEKLQFGCVRTKVPRQRVNNNLPGIPGFCPLIRKTDTLTHYINEALNEKAAQNVHHVRGDLLARAAAFLLLSDSKASYTIEGETPPHSRVERWGRMIGQAGRRQLSVAEIERLQAVVIPDGRFILPGIRCAGGFVGEHDRLTNIPIPEHISAKPEDLDSLLEAYFEAYQVMIDADYYPVLSATVMAFAFVFIHPLEDGNGRIHRYLMHHVLAESGFTPSGMVFPVSAVILQKIAEYKTVLEHFTQPRLKFIQWQPTENNNVHVTNETADLYRYGDMTRQAEFLFKCVRETVEHVLPQEVRYLQRYDEMWHFLNNRFDMPNKTLSLLLNFLQQNNGILSKRARTREFAALSEEEVDQIQEQYQAVFGEE